MSNSISVIIPTFRREEPLCAMLDTLLSQDVDDFEIILVDQTEKHSEETRRFLFSNSSRINVIAQHIPNLPMARNRGLQLARGKYLLFFDDDVLLPTDCVRRLVTHLASGSTDGVTGLINFDWSEEECRRRYGVSENRKDNKLIFVNHFIGAAMAFRREVYESIGGFDQRFGELSPTASGEDFEFCCRAKRKEFRLAIDPNIVIRHPAAIIHGGCAVRTINAEDARRSHIRSGFYIEMKRTDKGGKIDLRGWKRMLRGWAINKEVLKQNPLFLIGRLLELMRSYQAVLEFYRNNRRL